MKRTAKYWIVLLVLLLIGCSSGSNGAASTATAKPVTVKKLILAHPADKVTYEVGDSFDPTGAIVNAQLTDGTIEENVPFTHNATEPLQKGQRSVLYAYKDKTVGQSISVLSKGNNAQYSVENTEPLLESPLAGKTFFFLGSSVTAGAGSGGESMVDYIAKRNGAICIKEAVAGTTLADTDDEKLKSYVKRLDEYLAREDCPLAIDAFICQLSTNDRSNPELFGSITGTDVRSADAFDRTTTYGAMEYILATVRDKWDCPVLIYTNPAMDDDNYKAMVEATHRLAEKWGFRVIDLFHDAAFNDISEEAYVLYMADEIHPTKAGYREWWTPVFEQALTEVLADRPYETRYEDTMLGRGNAGD